MESPASSNEYDHLFKIVIIGNSAVGKSSILLRYVDNEWTDNFVPTIGVDFKVKSTNVGGQNVKLQIWDTAGQERFKNVTSSYYRGAHGIFLVYDITDTESFTNLNNWLIETEKHANKNAYKMLIGNKCDLENKRTVSYQQGKDFAEKYGMKFIETSAKDCTNVNEAFILISHEILNMSEIDRNAICNKEKKNINLDTKDAGIFIKRKKKCCK